MTTSPVEQLRTILFELLGQRDQLNRQIAAVRVALAEFGVNPEPDTEMLNDALRNLTYHHTPSVAEVVISLLRRHGEVTFRQIMEELHDRGNSAQSESVSSTLSRMVANGQIDKGSRKSHYIRSAKDVVLEQQEREEGLIRE